MGRFLCRYISGSIAPKEVNTEKDELKKKKQEEREQRKKRQEEARLKRGAGGILTGKFNHKDIEDPNCKEDGRYFAKTPWIKTYQDRFWRKELFEGVGDIQKALEEAYGKGTVTMAEAALRWLNHHSKLEPNGTSSNIHSTHM